MNIKNLPAIFSLKFYKWAARFANHYRHLHFSKIGLIHKGKGTVIAPTVAIGHAPNVFIGKNCLINHNCTLNGNGKGKVVLGDNVILAPNVYIASSCHRFQKGKLISSQPSDEADIIIGNDVWIGVNSVVLLGTTIQDGVVIGANSFVPKDSFLKKNCVYVGSPVRFLKKRET